MKNEQLDSDFIPNRQETRWVPRVAEVGMKICLIGYLFEGLMFCETATYVDLGPLYCGTTYNRMSLNILFWLIPIGLVCSILIWKNPDKKRDWKRRFFVLTPFVQFVILILIEIYAFSVLSRYIS